MADVVRGAHMGKFCSNPCYHKWRAGKARNSQRDGYLIYGGYRWVRVPENYNGGMHKGFMKNGKYLQEHRFVMEQHLGRLLGRQETIHHINFNKLDNRIDNLMLLTTKQHRRLDFALSKRYMLEHPELTKTELMKFISLEQT